MCGEKVIGNGLRPATDKHACNPKVARGLSGMDFVQEAPQQPSILEGLRERQRMLIKQMAELQEAIDVLQNHTPELENIYRKLSKVGAY